MPETTRRGWRELLRAMLRPSRSHLLVATVLLACGLVITLQVRSRSSEQDYSSLQRPELVAILDDLTAESRRLESELNELQSTQQRLRSGADRQQVALSEAERRRTVLSILGGTAPAEGPGVRVVITDPNRAVGEAALLNAIGELRDAGAEVIELNDRVRVVASTWVESRDGDLIVDGATLERPIVIEAIGEPHALSEALKFRGGLASEIEGERIRGTVTITTEEKVVVDAVRTPTEPRFARPA